MSDYFKRNILQKYVLIPCGICIVFLAAILYFNQAQTCTASDFSVGTKERTFSGFTKSEACTKAVAVCTYFSSNPKSCKIKP